MVDTPPTESQPTGKQQRWRPLGAIDRRVLGVLAEKAKTTPENYPMSLNAVVTACNQKSNRHPLMNLEADDVQESLDRLREMGAVGMVEGYGRVSKYRHYLYEWLGVEKVELAVMAELLLRGAQTEGELRGRAARMEPIADLSALRPTLDSLKAKKLVLPLTPEGRGHMVAHALYQPKEIEHLRAQYAEGAMDVPSSPPPHERIAPTPAPVAPWVPASAVAPPVSSAPGKVDNLEALRREVEGLRQQLSQVRSEIDELLAHQQQTDMALRELRDALGG